MDCGLYRRALTVRLALTIIWDVKPIKRATLADANEKRSDVVFS